jgi:hypothetical protein
VKSKGTPNNRAALGLVSRREAFFIISRQAVGIRSGYEFHQVTRKYNPSDGGTLHHA